MSSTDHHNEQLDTVDRLAYEMSQQSYLAPEKRAMYVQGYALDKEMSNTDTAVYHNHATKKTHVSNRGSTSAYDWAVSDGQILAGAKGYGAKDQGSRQAWLQRVGLWTQFGRSRILIHHREASR